MKTSTTLPPRATATAAENAEPRAWYPLVLIFAVLAMGICAGGIFSYRHYERHFRTEIEQQLAAITELKVEEIVQWRQERLLDAHYLRRAPYVARGALDVLTQPQSLATRQMFMAWLESRFAEGPYEQVLLLDERLNVVLVYPQRASGVLGDAARRAAQEVLSSQQVVLADLHREAEAGPVYLSLMVPLVVRPEGAGDKVQAAGKGSSPADGSAGLLVLQINAQKEFYPMIQRWPTPSRTAETLLVRRDGNDALFLNEIKFQTNTALKLRISLARTNVSAVKAVLGQEGIAEGIDYRGVPVVAALRAIPNSPWSMVTRMDTVEVYAPLRDRLWLTILLMGALLLGAAASVGLVWRHQRVQFYRERHAAAAAQARLLQILESSLNEIYIFEPESLRFEYVNRGALRNLGYTLEAMQGMTPLDLKPEFTEVSFRAALAPLLRHELEQRLFNTVQRRADGSLYPVEVHLQLVEVPGQRVFLAVMLDITERKLAEAAKQESEARFQTMANSMLQLAWIAKADGFIFWYNQRWYDYTGTTPEQMEGWGWQSVHDPNALPKVMENWKGALASGRPFEMEFPLRGADGRFRNFLTRGQPLKDAEGRVLQWFGTNTDVDDLKRAQEKVARLNTELEQRVRDRTAQLGASNKELEAFSYSVSHDLRAPLRAIDGFARMLDEDYTARLDDEGRRLLATICGEAKRMGQLIDDLLAFSRMSRQQLESVPIDIVALAQAVFDECAAQAPGRQLQFKVQPLPPGQGDRAMLRQALTNLCSNAIKYTRPRAVAEIEIGGRVEGDENLYYVKDNGVGFDVSYANKLFGVFQRLHNEDEFEGTGVGLALVQRVIHRHGGRVWAEAKLDGGATFYFTLPMRKDGR